MRFSRVAKFYGLLSAGARAMTPAMVLTRPNLVPAPMLPACVSRLRTYRFKIVAYPVALDILTGLVEPYG